MSEYQERTAMRLLLDDGAVLEEEILSLTWTSGCCGSAEGIGLGSTVAASLNIRLTDSGRALENAFVTLQGNSGAGWETLGRFRCETPETREGTVSVKAVDAMIWALEQGYYPTDPAPATALAVLRDICGQFGLTLGDVSGLTDTEVSGELRGWTARETVGNMAALLGRNAVIGRTGALELIWYGESGITLTPEDYYAGGFSHKDYDVTVNRITVSTGDGEEDVLTAGGGSGTRIFLSNPYMTQGTLDRIWQAVGGFSYRSGSVSLPEGLEICPGDLLTVSDPEGTRFLLPAMEVSRSYDGGLKTTVTAYGSAESDISYGYRGPATVAMDRYAADLASFRQLYAQNVTAVNAQIGTLTAQQASLSALAAQKADVDLLNVTVADIGSLLVRGGVLTDSLNAVSVNATRYLTGVTVVGDLVRANTLSANKLILTGADGLIYELNAQSGALTAAQLTEEQYRNAIDGSVLVEHSITADRIDVTDLFAQDITATGTVRGLNIVGATGSFSGSITSQQGSMGGWTLRENTLYSIGNEYFTVLRPAAKLTDSGLGILFGIGTSDGIAASNLFQSDKAENYLLAMYYDGSLEVQKLNVAESAEFKNVWITPENDTYPALTVEGETELDGNLAVSGTISEGGVSLRQKYLPLAGGTMTGAINARSGYGVHFKTPAGEHELVIRGVGDSSSHTVGILCDNSTARKIAEIDTANDTLTVGCDLTASGALNVARNINATGTVYATGGVVSANNYGYFVRNTGGSNVSLVNLNASNTAAVGNQNYPLNLYGTSITSSKPVNTASDSRLKHSVAALDERYEAFFDRLSPVSYRYNDQPEQERVGFVAQEVRQALAAAGITDSALVSEDSEGMLSIAYTELTGLLVHEVQRLRREVEALKEKGMA